MEKNKNIRLGRANIVFSGKIFKIIHKEVTFPNGEKDVFEYCERPPSVSVLALNEKNELLMIKEYRHGYKKDIWFLPGGRADQPKDTPIKAAQRELREETGYRAKILQLLWKKQPSNTLIWDIYVFFGKNLIPDPLPKDKGEKIEVKFVPLKKAAQMAIDGTIENEFISYNILRFNYLWTNGLRKF